MISTRIFSKAFAAGSVALGLLLGASAVQAADVIFDDPSRPTKATAIQDLNIGGTNYDVTFVVRVAAEIYGPYPGSFPFFNTYAEAEDAVDAVNNALQAEGALTVGEVTEEDGLPIFNIGYDVFIGPLGVETVNVARGAEETGEWVSLGQNTWAYNLDNKSYAVFTVAGGGPDQFTLTVDKAGEGSGTVTSTPSGIDCGSTCSTSFDDGTSVTLTATPDAGSTFSSWSGCEPQTQTQCSVTMTQATTVTVTFAIGGDSKNTGFLPAVVDVILE